MRPSSVKQLLWPLVALIALDLGLWGHVTTRLVSRLG